MTQYDFGTINPAVADGVVLADLLNAWRTGVHSSHRGAARPAYAVAGMQWAKSVDGSRTDLMYYDGTVDIMLVSVNPSTGAVIDAPAFMRNAGNLNAGTIPSARLVAADILALLLPVDGAGSGLDADKLDGSQGTYFLARANHTGTQTLATISDAGTAASKNTGTADGNVVEVQTGGGLPALKSTELLETDYNLAAGTVLNPSNGGRQYTTLTANRTFTESLADGQAIILFIDDGTGWTITWPTITWLTSDGLAPALAVAGYNVIVVFQMNGVFYGQGVKVG